jgi:membrane-associated phospholipid phosphatase
MLVATAIWLCAPSAHARGRALDYDDQRSALLLGASLHGFLFVELGWPTPERCGICCTNNVDLWVARTVGSWRHPELYADTSDVLLWSGVIGSGLASFAASGREQGFQDTTIIAQSVLLTAMLTSISKRLVARRRPGVHLDNPHAEIGSTEANLSFFSGHSSTAASAASSLATLAYLRGHGYRHAVLAAGVAYALTVGMLRIAAQRHWLTDVLMGWAVGAALGALVPLALYPRDDDVAEPRAPQRVAIPLVQLSF